MRKPEGGSTAALAALTVCAALECPATADLFASGEPLAIELAAPLSTVFRSREDEDREYQDAMLTYRDEGAAAAGVTVPLRVRVRGKSRAIACAFPPLLLNFRTADLGGTAFEGENKLKLVTHCQASDNYDKYVLLEYLTYRVQALVTPTSLRARLVEVRYLDTERDRELGTRPGILLEDEERFAERQGFTRFEGEQVDRARYDPEALAMLDVFQFFIGNTDWSAVQSSQGDDHCCHNVVPYVRADGSLVPVAYDFDSAGLVDPPHAAPDARLRIQSVRTRLYRGLRCRAPEELAPVFARFEELRPAILALFTEQPGLEAAVASRARAYIEDFYAVLGDAKQRDWAFFHDCDE